MSGAADCIPTGETLWGRDIITYMIATACLFLDTSRSLGNVSEETGRDKYGGLCYKDSNFPELRFAVS